MDKLIRSFAGRLSESLGTKLVSFIIYGSAAAGDRLPGSDINTLLVLEDTCAATLRSVAPAVSWWKARKQPPPLIFSEKEFFRSADSFPMEFTDIRETHEVILGRELPGSLKPVKSHLRLELEREIKAASIRLRQAYCISGPGAGALRKLMAGSVSTFIILIKSVLRLYGIKAPQKKHDILAAVPGKTGINSKVFYDVLAIKEGKYRPGRKETDMLFSEYLAEIDRLSNVIDAFSGKKAR